MADTKLEVKKDGVDQAAQPTPKRSLAEFIAQSTALNNTAIAQNITPIEAALQAEARKTDQRLEQQLYSTIGGWAGVVAALAKTTSLPKDSEQRRSTERMRDEMFAMMAKEEKKKKFRDSAFFRQLVTVLGESVAESITQKLETAGASGTGLQANKEALTQVAKEIATTLDRGAPQLKLSASGDSLAAAIESEIRQALSQLPKMEPVVSIAKSDDTLAVNAHEKVLGFKTSEERLLEVQNLRGTLGAERFAAMVDAYDKRYGVPFVAHVAGASTSLVSTQSEMVHEMRSVLTPAQQVRLAEFGRAEFSQALALLERKREAPERQLKVITGQIRETEKHLAETLGNPALATVPESEVRSKLLAEISNKFPELKGRGWDDVAILLKELAGERDEVARDGLLKVLSAGSTSLPNPELLELATRTSIHMQKIIVLDQQASSARSALAKSETGDEVVLRKHYTAVYGADATKASPELAALTKHAVAYSEGLDKRIRDVSLSSEERQRLVFERDAIEFGAIKKLVSAALEGAPPDAQRALHLLREFAVVDASTLERRSKEHFEAAQALADAIQNADTLRAEWQALTPETFADVNLDKPSLAMLRSCLGGRPVGGAQPDLARSFEDLKSAPTHHLTLAPGSSKGVSRKEQFDILAQQREAALSTRWFSQILDPGGLLEKGVVPLVTISKSQHSAALEARLGRIETARSGMDAANERARKGFSPLNQTPGSGFLRSNTLQSLSRSAPASALQKLGVASTSDAVAKLSRELEPVRELLVDKEVLGHLRSVVEKDSELGRALVAVGPHSDPQAEYQAIKSRLSLQEGLRLDTFIALETRLFAAKEPSQAKEIFAMVRQAEFEQLTSALGTACADARISRVERFFKDLSDDERDAILEAFLSTTRQSVGQCLIQGVPTGQNRAKLLARIAESRVVGAHDLESLFGNAVPASPEERGRILRELLKADEARFLDVRLVRQAAEEIGNDYATLRAAADAASAAGRLDILAEVTERMRPLEARLQGKIVQTVAGLDSGFATRQGVRAQLRAEAEAIFLRYSRDVHAANSIVAETARSIEELLRPEDPKTDAALNRLRQANLSEESTLYLRALYAQSAPRHTPGEGERQLSGELATDLKPVKPRPDYISDRITALAKGGSAALLRADMVTLKAASAAKDQKTQVETLSNLKATGQYNEAKETIAKTPLTAEAKEYHESVAQGDSLKTDATDLSVKATNRDLKPREVAEFAKGKTSEDFARINRENPKLVEQVKASDPTFFDESTAKVLSVNEAERKKAQEQAMLKTLSDPDTFATWLNVAPTKEARIELLRNVEALVEKEPTAPRFVASNEPKIVQFVRAQKSDFREMDAHLIKAIIVVAVQSGDSLKPDVLERIRALRAQASTQLSAMDQFAQPREAIVQGAREVKTKLDGYQIWATGSPELRAIQVGTLDRLYDPEGRAAKLKRREEILAQLYTRHPELAGRPIGLVERGEKDSRFRWRSGYLLDNPISLTEARIAEQLKLLAPMEAGLRDIQQSRELVRAGFALMAKDTVQEVYRGLSPEATEHVMTLLRQRDQKIEYTITNKKRHEEWSKCIEEAQKELDQKDKWTNVALTVGKVGTTLAAGVVNPWLGLGVAMSWNAGDKIYRYTVRGENLNSVLKAAALEGAIDLAFFSVAPAINKVILLGGEPAKQTGKEAIKATHNVWQNFWTRWFSKDAVKRVLDRPQLVHPDHLKVAPKWTQEAGQKFAEVSAKELEKDVAKAAGKEATKESLEATTKEALERSSKWFQMTLEKTRIIEGSWRIAEEPRESASPKPGTLPNVAPVKAPLGGQPPPNVEVQAKVNDLEYAFVVPTPPAAATPPAPPMVPPSQPTPQTPGVVAQPPIDPQLRELRDLQPVPPVTVSERAPISQPSEPAASRPDVAASPIVLPPNDQNQRGGGSEPPSPPPTTPPAPPAGPASPDGKGGDGGTGDAPGRALPVAQAGPVMSGNGGGGSGDQNGAPNSSNISTLPQAPGYSLMPEPNQVSNPSQIGIVNPYAAASQNPSSISTPTVEVVSNPQAGLQPVLDQNPFAIARPQGAVDPARNSEAVPSQQTIVQPTAMTQASASATSSVTALDASLTPMARADIQSAIMHNPSFVPGAVAEAQRAASEQPELIPNPQSRALGAPSKASIEDDFVFVVAKKDAVTMKRRDHSEKNNGEGESLPSGHGLKTKDARKQTSTTLRDSDVASVAKVPHEKKVAVSTERTTPTGAVVAKVGELNRKAQGEPPSVHAQSPRKEAFVQVRGEGAPRLRNQESSLTSAGTQSVKVTERIVSHVPRGREHYTQTIPDSGATEGIRRPSSQTNVENGVPVQRQSLTRVDASVNGERVRGLTSAPPVQGGTPQAISQSQRSAREISEDSPPQIIADTGTKSRARSKNANSDVRMRQIILQQLMTQHLNQLQREKLLKALIDLGISESEYRALVAKLGEMETARLAQAQVDLKKFAEPIAVTGESAVSPPPANTDSVTPKTVREPSPKASRARIYRDLKGQKEGSAKTK